MIPVLQVLVLVTNALILTLHRLGGSEGDRGGRREGVAEEEGGKGMAEEEGGKGMAEEEGGKGTAEEEGGKEAGGVSMKDIRRLGT